MFDILESDSMYDLLLFLREVGDRCRVNGVYIYIEKADSQGAYPGTCQFLDMRNLLCGFLSLFLLKTEIVYLHFFDFLFFGLFNDFVFNIWFDNDSTHGAYRTD